MPPPFDVFQSYGYNPPLSSLSSSRLSCSSKFLPTTSSDLQSFLLRLLLFCPRLQWWIRLTTGRRRDIEKTASPGVHVQRHICLPSFFPLHAFPFDEERLQLPRLVHAQTSELPQRCAYHRPAALSLQCPRPLLPLPHSGTGILMISIRRERTVPPKTRIVDKTWPSTRGTRSDTAPTTQGP